MSCVWVEEQFVNYLLFYMSNLVVDGLQRHWRLAYMGTAAIIAILFDVLFWKADLGLNVLILTLVYLAGFITLSALSGQLHQPKALILTLPILILAGDIVLYNNDLVSGLVPIVLIFLLFIFSLLLTLRNPDKHLFSFLNIYMFREVEMPLFKLGQMYRDLFASKKEVQNEKYKKIAIALAISVPILLVFGSLFAQADKVFAETIATIFDFEVNLSTLWRLVRFIALSALIGSIFYSVIDPKHALGEKIVGAVKLDSTIVTTILALVNALFALFVFIQFRYLFGAREVVLEIGATYAEYARSGFFELVWVMVLAGLMLAFFYRSGVYHGMNAALKFLKLLLIVQIAVIAFSALQRMNLYQEGYGFTVHRLYVEWFIYASLVIFGLAAWSIVREWKFRQFFYSSAAIGLGAFVLVASMNVDRMIAHENVRRAAEEGKKIDIAYLTSLSEDAIPEFGSLAPKVSSHDNTVVLSFDRAHSDVTNVKTVGYDEVGVTTYNYKYVKPSDSWRGFNYGRYLAEKEITRLQSSEK